MLEKTFKNKKVLITGHTGFKGSWLALWLHIMGAKVTGISLKEKIPKSHFVNIELSKKVKDIRLDIRDQKKFKKEIIKIKPDFIFHLAAQALVNESYINPIKTWETNVMGTINLLDSIRSLKNKCSVVLITSDKCYDNVEWVWGYRETDKLGGPDPYSGSKAGAELAINSYVKSFFNKKNSNIRIASARAGNVIGGGDWSENRIIPDVVKSWNNGLKAELRNPHSTRPWQHVLEPLSGYLCLAANLDKNFNIHGESFNFGPNENNNYSVLELVKSMSKHKRNSKWYIKKIPNQNYESSLLKLNCDKALFNLSWHSILTFEETVKMTMDWYGSHKKNEKIIINTSIDQIKNYRNLINDRATYWKK